MGCLCSKPEPIIPPAFPQGEIDAFVAAGSSSSSDSFNFIVSILDRGLPIDSRAMDDDGMEFTCLLRACRADNDSRYDLVEFLLSRGADPNIKTKRGGHTSAQLAIMNNSPRVLQLLLNNGYDPLLRDETDRQEKAIDTAIRKGRTPNYNPRVNGENGIDIVMEEMLRLHGDMPVKLTAREEGEEDEENY